VTHKEVDKVVMNWVAEVTEEARIGEFSRGSLDGAVQEVVDSHWHELGFPAGRIDSWPVNPGAEVLGLCGTVLDYCDENAWIEDDSGLWEGLHGAAVLGCQAYHSLINVVWQKLRHIGVTDRRDG